ncbi:MAG: hypothetical protein ACRD8U_18690 [Pyrinomonadaceae bacterium]
MNREINLEPRLHYKPEGWRDQESSLGREAFARLCSAESDSVRSRSLVLELLGRINYKIISGNKIYVEVAGTVYKTLYGAYWRSVFTGIEHYSLKCEEISPAVWTKETDSAVVDLPVDYSNDGWTVGGYSLSFMLARD